MCYIQQWFEHFILEVNEYNSTISNNKSVFNSKFWGFISMVQKISMVNNDTIYHTTKINKTLCNIPYWQSRDSFDSDHYTALQNIAYVNFNAPQYLLSRNGELLYYLTLIPALYMALRAFKAYTHLQFKNSFLVEIFILLLPTVTCCIYPKWWSPQVLVGISVLFTLLLRYFFFKSSHTIIMNIKLIKNSLVSEEPSRHSNGNYVYISLFRASLAVSSIEAIMGVDFLPFQRHLAKSETFGMSLMDTGVGAVIFASALTRSKRNHTNFLERLHSLIKKLTPVLCIGLLREICVHAMNYHVSITEYGTCWNFFISIFFVTTLSEIILSLCSPTSVCLIIAIIGLGYQTALTIYDKTLIHWIFTADRNNFFSSNREGILGCLGFTCIYLIGALFGMFYLQVNHAIQTKNRLTRILQIFQYLSIFAICVIIENFFLYIGWIPSRRLANLPYVNNVIASNMIVLISALIVECLITHPIKGPNNYYLDSIILSCAHTHQFLFFLISNMFVGAINLCCRTLLLPPFLAQGVLFIYCLSWSYFGLILEKYKDLFKPSRKMKIK